MDLGLDGAVVLVTGGVRGVGAGITRVFLRAGATVVTCARNEPENAVEVDGRAAEFLACDVRDADQVHAMVATIVERHGHLDALVNNAGGSPYALAADASPKFHAKIVELNLLAPLLVAQAANAVMQTQDGGGRSSTSRASAGRARRPAPLHTAQRRPESTVSEHLSRSSGHRRCASTRWWWAW